MLSHLALSWHLPPARFMLCTMPYFWMTARYAALVYWLPRSECTMALYLLYPAVQRVDRNLQLLCCFCWFKVFGELDRLHFVFLVVSFIFPFFYFIPLWLMCQVLLYRIISTLHVIGSVWQLLYKRFLKLCCFDVLNMILHFRRSKIECVCCTHVSNLFEHTHQFRQACIVGDSGAFLEFVAGRSKLPFCFLFPEYRYPVVEIA